MNFAVIQTGGKQYQVAPGDILKVEKLPPSKDKEVVFDQVLLTAADGQVKTGRPLVPGVRVAAERLEDGRGRKVDVVHFKAKTRYRKLYGHRQPYTRVRIKEIK